MRILITGGAGFIGCNLAHACIAAGHTVTLLDNLSRRGSPANLAWLRSVHGGGLHGDGFGFVQADIRDAEAMLPAAEGQDAIYHLAAQTAVTTSVTDPRTDFEINALGTFNVLEAARQAGNNPVFIYSSTNKVYGGMEDAAAVEQATRYVLPQYPDGVGEDRPLDFHSPYGCSKGSADQYVHDYSRIYGLRSVVFRQSCIYGQRQMGVEDQGWVAWFVIASVLGRPITIYGDGKQVRDLLHVDDLVRAFLMADRTDRRDQGPGVQPGRRACQHAQHLGRVRAALERARRARRPSGRVQGLAAGRSARLRGRRGQGAAGVWLGAAGGGARGHRAADGVGEREPGLVRVKILFILTYYRPHVSGLTIYVERLARALAARGHEVTVLTSRYNRDLSPDEIMDGVRVVRVPVWLRFNKGVLMPGFAGAALREIGRADVVSIHLPQVEAALTALLTRLKGRKPLITYHCDLEMPPVWYGKLVNRVTYWNNVLAGRLADTIVAYTADFARHSPFLSRFAGPEVSAPGKPASRTEPQTAAAIAREKSRSGGKGKVRVILPPVVIPDPTPDGVAALRQRIGIEAGDKVVGFAARFAYEKGAGYLINAIPHILKEEPCLKVVFAGPYGRDVIGETIWDDLQPLITQYKPYLTFLGTLNPEQMANFFALCDVVTVASINNTESFGLVQVESFMCGTPVVATNLPGVRQPVTMTGMGEIVPIADAVGLAQGLVKVLRDPERYVKPREEIGRIFEMKHTVDEYEALFKEKRVR